MKHSLKEKDNQKNKGIQEKQWNTVKRFVQMDAMIILPVILALQAFLMMVLVQAVTFADYNVLYDWFDMKNLRYLVYNFLLFFVVLQIFVCVTKRVTPGFVVVTIFSVVVSVINNMKWLNLKECVIISDLEKFSEALKVAGEAEFELFPGAWVCILIGVLLLVLMILLDLKVLRDIRKNKDKKSTCYMTLAILVAVLIPVAVADAKAATVGKLTESNTAEKTGPILYFVESIFTGYLEEPYTTEEAKDSYDALVSAGKELVEDSALTSSDKPNIIVIMSEAFFDVNQFEGVMSYSEDPMSYYKEVESESVVSGDTKVNIYGGSTHFSEFEFLTGFNSKGMNSGSCPYKVYYNEEQPSFARYLREQGYFTLAIHPYDGYFWNRKNAYPNMGFERFVDRKQMEYTDMCGYISDDALTNEIIYRYELQQNKGEQPFFCFGVSIANHVAIINKEPMVNCAEHIDITYHEDIGYSDIRTKRVKQYIGGISKAGEALQDLTEYFKQQEEPTVVVFFGDHAPNYAVDILSLNGKEERCYTTPYLIWSNYDMGEVEEVSEMNVSYLSTYLMQLLDMPLAQQNYYNIALHHLYPYETRYEIADTNGTRYEDFSKEQKDTYFEHALDLKRQIPALLEEPECIEKIWKAFP
ncbi:MAG: LTA synthase family protein [Lachnospiraceae bacterium]|nr:LTA synthase family protein [Lachnospiraceae bacterium]